MHDLIRVADEVYNNEARLFEEAKKPENYDRFDKFVSEKQLELLVIRFADRVIARAEQDEHIWISQTDMYLKRRRIQ